MSREGVRISIVVAARPSQAKVAAVDAVISLPEEEIKKKQFNKTDVRNKF